MTKNGVYQQPKIVIISICPPLSFINNEIAEILIYRCNEILKHYVILLYSQLPRIASIGESFVAFHAG